VEGDISIDSETLLGINFMNLKIKLAQSFECTHNDRVCIGVFIRVSAHIYIYIYEYLRLYYVSHKHCTQSNIICTRF
jgi:hypothetical protein